MQCASCQTENVDGARFCAKCGALLPVTSAAADDPLIGQVIKNTFRVVRLLGEGGMGRVYEGEQQMGTTTRKVAIKTLHPHLSQDPSIVARFNRECGTVAELEHPNTIQFFDFGQTADGTLFIAMEFLEGQPVSAILESQGPMPASRVEHILRQVCGSLAEAHKKGIIHRDLKPENVVLTTRAGEADFVKVLDFGIAARREGTDPKQEQKLTQQGTVLGTPPYMSPEQFTGKELDARSDIYSLGVMAYEMLTGKLPFDAATPWEWATKHLTEQPYPFEVTGPTAASIPANVKAAIMRALAKSRDDRQADVMQFFDELSGRSSAPEIGHAATAAMAAPPPELFQKGGTQLDQPVYNPAAAPMAPPPTANEMVMPVPAAYPAPGAPARRASSGGKGIFIALGGALVGIIAIIGVIVAVRGAGSDDEPDTRLSLGALGSATGVTEINPIGVPSGTVAAVDTAAVASADTAQTAAATTTTTTPATTRPSSTGTGTSTAKPPSGPQGEAACQASYAAANNGAIEQAVSLYKACQNGGKTANLAKAAIARNAGPAAQRARFNKDCKRARSIASAAASIGAAGTSQKEADQCK